MRIAGSSLLYSRLSLEDACRRLGKLDFDAVDVAMQEGWAHVDPSTVATDVDAAVDRIEGACASAGTDPVALNVNVGDVPLDTEIDRIDAIVDLAEVLGVDVVTLPAASTESPLAEDLDRFRALVDVAADRDVMLTVETHWGTHTEDPAVATEYADAVPGLGYTLNPGHYVIRDEGEDPWAILLDDVEHVHLRQAGTGWAEIQQSVEDGRLDVESFVGMLQDSGYDGAVTVEYIDSLDGVDPAEAERQAGAFRDMLVDIL